MSPPRSCALPGKADPLWTLVGFVRLRLHTASRLICEFKGFLTQTLKMNPLVRLALLQPPNG